MPKGNLVSGYLQEILKNTEDKGCVFRGQCNSHWELTSGADRRIEESMQKFADGESLQTNNLALLNYHEGLINKAKQMGFDYLGGRALSSLEILAQLQHFGAATLLVDFTKQALVALYFACQRCTDNNTTNGKVFIVPHRNMRHATINDSIKNVIDSDVSRCWYPSLHGPAERRIASQSGLFLMNMPRNWDNHCIIKGEDKEKVLQELSEVYQISVSTLFMDLSGFAQSESHSVNLEDKFAQFHTANALLGDLDE